jgi:putative DNA primase/helicase
MNTIEPTVNIFDLQEAIASAPTTYPRYSRGHAAEVFVALNAGLIKYLEHNKDWAVWDADRWSFSKVAAFGAMARLSAGLAALAAADADLGRGAAAAARSIASDAFITGALTIARELCAEQAVSFDADPWLLNVPNGVVDLRSGRLLPHDPKYLMTRMASATYHPDAEVKGTRFEQFISEVFSGDAELINFMQRELGYCLTGDISTHAMFFWYGTGRNGKSTLAELVKELMGSYARKIGGDVLMASKQSRHPTELAQLRGLRLAVASEIEKGSYWNEARLKELTGDDEINARGMGQDFSVFRRTHKLIIQGNNKPRLREVDPAVKARLKLTPFEVNFDALGKLDPELPGVLRQESAAVMRWLVDGARAYAAAGCKLITPRVVTAATDDYVDENDLLQEWLNERCVVNKELNERGHYVVRERLQVLYSDYAEWKKERGESVDSIRGLREMLKKAGFHLYHTEGRSMVGGVGLGT